MNTPNQKEIKKITVITTLGKQHEYGDPISLAFSNNGMVTIQKAKDLFSIYPLANITQIQIEEKPDLGVIT